MVAKMVASIFFYVVNGGSFVYNVSLFFNIIFLELASLAAYQFVFFAYTARCRYEAFVAHAKQKLTKFIFGRVSSSDSEENIKLIEDLAHLHFAIAKVLDNINAVFSIEVSGRPENVLIEKLAVSFKSYLLNFSVRIFS